MCFTLVVSAQLTSINGRWEVWSDPNNNPPADWRTNTAAHPNWVSPSTGIPTNNFWPLNQVQNNFVNGATIAADYNSNNFNLPSNQWSFNNWVWAPTATDSAFLRLVFVVGDGPSADYSSCENLMITTMADNEHTVWLNGNFVTNETTWSEWEQHQLAPSALNCGTNIITVHAVDYSGFYFFLGELSSDGTECCNAEIDLGRAGCTTFNPTVSGNNVDVKEVIWTLDGEPVLENGGLLTLTPGTYELCANYLGSTISNACGEDICCGKVCETISIPQAEFVHKDITICESKDPLNHWYNPCDEYSDFSYYISRSLTSPNPGYNHDSRSGGCIAHELIPGTFEFDFYDENDCLIRTLTVTVTVDLEVESSCEITVDLYCGMDLDLNQFAFCPDCTPSEFPWSSWTRVVEGADQPVPSLLTNVTEPGVYRRVQEDLTQCTRCEITVNVNVRRDYQNHIILLSPPCTGVWMDVAQLNTIMQNVNADHCNGSYTSLNVMEMDVNLMPTGFNFTLSSGGLAHNFQPGVYFIRPTDPAACCEVRLWVQCDDGMIPPPIIESNHDFFMDVEFTPYVETENLFHDSQTDHADEPRFWLVPNPAEGKFRILSNNKEHEQILHVMIYKQSGSLVKQLKDYRAGEQINISDLAAGGYLVVIGSGKDATTLRLINK